MSQQRREKAIILRRTNREHINRQVPDAIVLGLFVPNDLREILQDIQQ